MSDIVIETITIGELTVNIPTWEHSPYTEPEIEAMRTVPAKVKPIRFVSNLERLHMHTGEEKE